MASKTRRELHDLFKSGAKPTGQDFKDLIDSALNINDDGIEKPGSKTPLKIMAQGDNEKLLDFYVGEALTWSLSQKPIGAKPGLNFETGGTSRLFIENANGNVGIGTTTPTEKLSVSGNTTIAGNLSVTGGASNNLTVAGTSTLNGNTTIAGNLSVTGSSNSFSVAGNSILTGSLTVNNTVSLKGSANATGLSVDSNGNVSMGGTLNFGSRVGQHITLWQNSSGTGEYGIGMQGIGIQSGTQYFRTAKNFAWYKGGSHVDTELSPGPTGTPGTAQMVIKDGNVGIGTATPAAKLAVNGGLHVGGDSDPGDNNLLVDGTLSVTGTSSFSSYLVVGSSVFSNPSLYNSLIDVYGSNNAGVTVRSSGGRRTTMISHDTYGSSIGTDTNHSFALKTNDIVRMTLNTSGNVGIGTANPRTRLHVAGDITFGPDVTGQRYIIHVTAGGDALRICPDKSDGSDWDWSKGPTLTRSNGDWSTTSDLRLKTDIENENNILKRLTQLKVKNFRWKNDPDSQTKMIGFIAQEVQPLFPTIVNELVDPEEGGTLLTLKYAEFGVLAIGGLNELKNEKDTEVAELKAKFEAEINNLKTQMKQLQEQLLCAL